MTESPQKGGGGERIVGGGVKNRFWGGPGGFYRMPEFSTPLCRSLKMDAEGLGRKLLLTLPPLKANSGPQRVLSRPWRPKTSQSQRNRCVLTSQSTKSQAFLQKSHESRQKIAEKIADKCLGHGKNTKKNGAFPRFKNLIFLSMFFWISLLFLLQRTSLLFGAFLPSFPGISGVQHSEEILVFWVVVLAFPKTTKEDQGIATFLGRQGHSISQNAHPASPFDHSQRRHCKERLAGPRKAFG